MSDKNPKEIGFKVYENLGEGKTDPCLDMAVGNEGRPLHIKPDKDGTINWQMYEESGSPIFHVPDPSVITEWEQIFVRDHWITTEDGLHEGMSIVIETLFGPARATIEKDEYGVFHAMSGESMSHVLKWWDDGKVACWTCIGSCNLKALKRLTIKEADNG